jgi:serine acetyltransferase
MTLVPQGVRRQLEAKGVRVGEGVVLEGQLAVGQKVDLWHHCLVGFDDESRRSPPRLVSPGDASSRATVLGDRASISPYAMIQRGARIGKGVAISEFSRIGKGTIIGDETVVEYGAKIYNDVSIGKQSIVAGFCCNDSKIGDCTTMLGHLVHSYRHRMCAPEWNDTEERPRGPTVESNAVVGYNAIVIGDVTVGHDSYVAAGAIITKDVPPYEKHIMKVDIKRVRKDA